MTTDLESASQTRFAAVRVPRTWAEFILASPMGLLVVAILFGSAISALRPLASARAERVAPIRVEASTTPQQDAAAAIAVSMGSVPAARDGAPGIVRPAAPDQGFGWGPFRLTDW